jgi:penicillin-binding protein 1B
MARKKTWWRKILLCASILFGVALVAFAIWVYSLDRTIRQQFEGRRWSLPAQVYAQPLELYAGQKFSADALELELRRLGYRKADNPTQPGGYRRRGLRIDFIARQFRFVDEQRAAQPVSVLTGGEGIEKIWDGSGAELPVFRMDPLLIGSIFPIHGEDRIIVTPEQTPELLPAALKVVEDRNFDTHWGVNPWAILRAVWVNLRAGHVEQGGSTLTQQLVKSYFLDSSRTYSRKIEEAVMAVLLEVHFEKTDLMNAYINEIHLGQEGDRAIHGFGLASQFYFGKPLEELELHEIATLVTIARGPSYYDPRRHAERVLSRRNLVLDLLAQFKVVTTQQAAVAKAKPLTLRGQNETGSGYYPAFIDLVRRTLRRDYREADLTEAGLKIFSTLDPGVQSQAEQALVDELNRLDQKARRKKAQLDGAVVVTTPHNGEVLAVVGGRRVSFDGYNRALDAKRSIGSLVKPVVYLAAMQSQKYNAASILDDSPFEVKLENGQVWRPKNYIQEANGPVPVVRALAQSLNLASARLGLDVGLPQVIKTFTQLGLDKEPPQLPSVLLGSLDIAPLDVAQIYNSLANGGFRTPLRAVRAVVDEQGEPLKAFPLEITPVADPAAVYQVTRMMQTVMENGSGRGARSRLPKEMIVAGKTGTSSDYRDSWFAGFSGSHLAIVWVGYDDNSSTGLTGSNGAGAVWGMLMSKLPTRSWSEPIPDGLKEQIIDFQSGEAARVGCVAEPVTVVIPQATELPVHDGCGTGFGERIIDWVRGNQHR